MFTGGNIAILCNGEFPRGEYPLYLLDSADFIVCCDGAASKLLEHNPALVEKAVVIGDMDSIDSDAAAAFEGKFVRVGEQDDNDQTKAMRYVTGHFPDAETITILGATGLREDHTIGNISLLMEYTRMFPGLRADVRMVSDHSTIFAVTDTTELHVGEGRSISILTPDNTLQIHSEGLVWPTDDVIFDNWWKATLNRSSSDVVKLSFSHPSLAVLILD